jgi:two-component sensor histidine kinase
MTARPTTVAVVLAGAAGLGIVVAAVLLPYAAYLRRPDIVGVTAGLAVIVSGLVLLRSRAHGPVAWLVLAAGYTWFVPLWAVPGIPAADTALRCTALMHIAFLAHAVIVVGSARLRGAAQWLAVTVGYVAALTAVVGGFQVALPAAGVCLTAAVLSTGHRLPQTVRALRTAAGLVLGVGLVGDAVLRALVGMDAEAWVAVGHPAGFATTGVLVAVAGTRRQALDEIELGGDGMAHLTSVIRAELGDEDIEIALHDGNGGWLRPSGDTRPGPAPSGYPVRDASGVPCAVLEGALRSPVSAAVEDVLRLAAANARLRRSIVAQVEALEASRRRLLEAADSERAALGAQLRTRATAHVAEMERELSRDPALDEERRRARTTRHALESIVRGIDPLGSGGTLRSALAEMARTASCDVVIDHIEEPVSRDVARALWFCSAEAATNTAKHAGGAGLHIAVRRAGAFMLATFVDSGPGGADPSGTGLRGLNDRVDTLGGAMTVSSPALGGTRLEIVLPDPDQDCGYPQGDLAGDVDSLAVAPTYRRSHRLLGGTS